MRHILEQNDKYDCAIAPQAKDAGVETSSYYDMGPYGIAAFIVQAGADDDDAVCQIMQATSSGGAGAKAMTNGPQSGTVTLTGDGSTAQCDVIECTDRNLDVDNLYQYIAIRMTVGGQTSLQIAAVLDRGNCRHSDSTMPA